MLRESVADIRKQLFDDMDYLGLTARQLAEKYKEFEVKGSDISRYTAVWRG